MKQKHKHGEKHHDQTEYYGHQYQGMGRQRHAKMQGAGMQNQHMMQGNPQMPQQGTAAGNPYINQGGAMPQTNPYMNAAYPPAPGLNTAEILTGALIGAAATYILTNENVQKSLFKGIVSMGDIIGGGLDEMKERFEDAKAEYEAQKSGEA